MRENSEVVLIYPDQNRVLHCVPTKLDGLPLSRAQIIQICGHRKFKVSGISGDELPEKLNTENLAENQSLLFCWLGLTFAFETS